MEKLPIASMNLLPTGYVEKVQSERPIFKGRIVAIGAHTSDVFVHCRPMNDARLQSRLVIPLVLMPMLIGPATPWSCLAETGFIRTARRTCHPSALQLCQYCKRHPMSADEPHRGPPQSRSLGLRPMNFRKEQFVTGAAIQALIGTIAYYQMQREYEVVLGKNMGMIPT